MRHFFHFLSKHSKINHFGVEISEFCFVLLFMNVWEDFILKPFPAKKRKDYDSFIVFTFLWQFFFLWKGLEAGKKTFRTFFLTNFCKNSFLSLLLNWFIFPFNFLFSSLSLPFFSVSSFLSLCYHCKNPISFPFYFLALFSYSSIFLISSTNPSHFYHSPSYFFFVHLFFIFISFSVFLLFIFLAFFILNYFSFLFLFLSS